MIIFGALMVLIAQLTTNMAADVVSPAHDFSSLLPRRISYRGDQRPGRSRIRSLNAVWI